MKYPTLTVLGIGAALTAFWVWVAAKQTTPVTTNDLSALFAGWAFVAAVAALIQPD